MVWDEMLYVEHIDRTYMAWQLQMVSIGINLLDDINRINLPSRELFVLTHKETIFS